MRKLPTAVGSFLFYARLPFTKFSNCGKLIAPHKTEYFTPEVAFYLGKNADFSFRISGVNVERFCVVANRGRAFFGVCDFVLRTLFYL